ncbi:hypothetical protein E2493_20885 [Sphingomonas parva]|uniref:DUF1269 domain-containing protein n=1 Tax=Sphingomonas parva TaxID=2555898 RepID=A0A4Y8ZJY3_9SPHN|nr:hypothetical protein [Sphingomonas parva]TFI56301.1 hypothetical protein E2493_20885 [Sphingomonas parva]
MHRIVSAVFNNYEAADHAVARLRRAGVPDEAISIVGRRAPQIDDTEIVPAIPDSRTSGTIRGLGVGAGVGALFGLAALAVPGAGPFIAAGALSAGLGSIVGTAASGAIVGGSAGGLAGALIHYGVSDYDARRYEAEVHAGGIWIGVDTRLTNADPWSVAALLAEQGGRALRSEEPAVGA